MKQNWRKNTVGPDRSCSQSWCHSVLCCSS